MDWAKIAVVAIEAIGECCGCSITGWDAERYLKEHLTEKEHQALIKAYTDYTLDRE